MMETLKKWFETKKFEAHLLAFLLMVLPPVALYRAAESGADGWIWVLLGVVALGNLLAIRVK